jgi:hypothetical protein
VGAEYEQIPILARRGERITEDLAERIAEQPVNLVRVISRRAGAEARGVAPETIRNPVSLPVQVFKPKTAAYLAPPGTVLTPEVTGALYDAQIEGSSRRRRRRTRQDFGRPRLHQRRSRPPARYDIGRIALVPARRPTYVTPVVTKITAWLSANEEEVARIAQANAPLTRRATSRTSSSSAASGVTSRSCGRTRSTTWTSRRTSSSRSPPR